MSIANLGYKEVLDRFDGYLDYLEEIKKIEDKLEWEIEEKLWNNANKEQNDKKVYLKNLQNYLNKTKLSFYKEKANKKINELKEELNRFYRDEQKEIVIDKKSGLIWQDNKAQYYIKNLFGQKKLVGSLTWKQALNYAKLLNKEKFGGFDDWRVPTIEELLTIVDYNKPNIAIKEEFKNLGSFHKYWSFTTHTYTNSVAWYVDFWDGSLGNDAKINSYLVRCVRSDKPIESSHFKRDNKKEIVIDLTRNLMWQDNSIIWPDTNSMNWQEAINYAKKLNEKKFGGFDDWRVPTIEELLTIVDYHNKDYLPAIKKEFKNASLNEKYWSSTTYIDDTSCAWAVDFNWGKSYYRDKFDYCLVRCVRSG